MVWKPHTISLSFQYQVTSYQYQVTAYQYHWNDSGIPHSIPSFQSCHWVSGVLFTKYEKYFCRLQYWSIGLHLLWIGSSGFCWHFKLWGEAIQWTQSFENQFNWALSQVWLWVINHKPIKIIYLALAIQLTSQMNQYCIHCNNMAFDKQRKWNVCVLDSSPEQWQKHGL